MEMLNLRHQTVRKEQNIHLVVGLAYELNEMFKENGIDDTFKKSLNNTVRFSYDNFEPEMVEIGSKTIMKDYPIRFHVRTGFEKDSHKILALIDIQSIILQLKNPVIIMLSPKNAQ